MPCKYVCLPGFSGFSMVVQKVRKERAPEAVVVMPMLVDRSNGTVFVNHHWDQKALYFCLSLMLQCPLPWGNGHWLVGPRVVVIRSLWPLRESAMLP